MAIRVVAQRRRWRAFNLLELLITCSLFILLSTVLVATLTQVSNLWRRSNSRDDAVRQLLKAKTTLIRDLMNGSQQTSQFASAKVPSHLSGSDGDGLTFLSSDGGQSTYNWSAGSSGKAVLPTEITYYLVVPSAANSANSWGITCSTGPADSAGYEQQCPFKWLVRRVDTPNPLPTVIDPNWKSWMTQPSSLSPSSSSNPSLTTSVQVICDQMFQFRVLATAPVWQIQISAVAVSDATRQMSVGNVSLEQSRFTLQEQFCVTANN